MTHINNKWISVYKSNPFKQFTHLKLQYLQFYRQNLNQLILHPYSLMPTQKQTLIQLLEQKKIQLKDLQDKCQLQNKKIKLFRKQNQDLTSVIQERQQVDTTLLLQSKQILTNNTKLQKTIEDLKQQLEIAKKNHSQKTTNNNNNKENSLSTNSNNQKPQITYKKKALNSIVSIKDITVTQSTFEIDLPNSQLTDDDFLQLQNFTQLKAIAVNQNMLTNPSITMICSRFINLQKLNLANNKFISQALQSISKLKNLKVLDIRNNNLGDQALKHISELKSLCELSCSKNSLTDKGASYLPNLSNLNYLDITNNQLTSESSQHLSKLQKITHLYLMSNKLSKDGIIDLMRNSKKLQFLDVRFNVWQNEEKQEIKKAKGQNLEVFC